MTKRWYKEAVIYCVEVEASQDSDGDGYGDLQGLISRLDYLSRLGVTVLWLNPIHPTPHRDNGYDVADYYTVDPRLGTLGDFAELTQQARQRGIRILLDLVVNHTSDQHPWFLSARSDPQSPYRDWYIWSETEPADRRQGIVFPGEQTETWSFDPEAASWFFHRFYEFQPDLNWSNPDVRSEISKVMRFWLQLGASGFRIDAAPFVLEQVRPGEDPAPKDFSILDDWRQDVQWSLGDAVLLCEANVSADELPKYCAAAPEGPNDRAHMLFAFLLNVKLWLGLARHDSEAIVDALAGQPRIPATAQWATFLRNHDELDLSQLMADQRDDVFKAFAPADAMRIYGRGIRRRLAPMLKGERRRIELAYALQFALPGSPVLRYGEEIGMGENLGLPGRNAIRTPMQWNDGPVGGFSTSEVLGLARNVSMRGRYGAKRANVQSQISNPASLLRWFEQLIATLRECPEIGNGRCTIVEADLPRPVVAHRMDAPQGSILLLHNLGPDPLTLNIGKLDGMSGRPFDVLADTPYPRPTKRLANLELQGWGYRWIRLRGQVTPDRV